ncbi:glutathione S-transferase family protein [Phyllobacterium salinisoli]|uniref:Glutathione S-transferase family protein n=1 Tax=Phyllobacterium salinisoli TaxID=1899321 RepID=A0A368K6G5_9HYPH|nr:glutathione S-transferase family protein [Phyllobacterium salinisoli]RCS24804.1 glutathione S-transferase family protein [Phyllobacterium salinisoli]
MLTLFHHPMSSGSRYARLILNEYGVDAELIDEKPWARRKEFLALNPAGTLPVLLAENDVPVVGPTVIAEYLDETRGALKRSRRLLPESPIERAEVRRLVDWFLGKLDNEVTRHIARERVFKLQMAAESGGSSPDSTAIRAARANIRQHMKYLDYLAATRDWLAGTQPSYADMAAAAAISILDYLGEIEWPDHPAARDWYTRMKSRPSFRPLLTDRIRGLSPVAHYGDLDF